MSGVGQRTPQWFAERSLRLSGSVLEQAKGLSKFGGPEDIFKPKPVNHHMQRGIDNEPLLRSWYSEHTGFQVDEPDLCLTTHTWNHRLADGQWLFDKYGCQSSNSYHPNWFLVGSPDGIAYTGSEFRLLEIKSPARLPHGLVNYLQNPVKVWRHTPTIFFDHLPARLQSLDGGVLDGYGHIYRSHFWQMQFYMGLMGLMSADYVVGGPGFGYLETVWFDEEYWSNFLYPECVHYVEQYIHPILNSEEGQQRLANNDQLRLSLSSALFTVS